MTFIGLRNNDAVMGAVYMLLSCLIFSCMGGMIRYISSDMHPFVIVFFRTIVGLVFLLPTLRRTGLAGMKTDRLNIHIVRGLVSAFTALAAFYAISHIPLANAVSYSFAGPIFATLLAVFLLKEKIRLPRISATFFGFVGVLVLLRPGAIPFSMGTGAALFSAFSIAVVIICVRMLSSTERPNVIALYSFAIALPITFIAALFVWQWPTGEQALIMIIIGICSSFAQLFLAKAFSLAETTAIMPLDFSRLIFSAIIGYSFFNEAPDRYTFIGAGIIMVSALYAAHREAIAIKRLKAEKNVNALP